MNRLVSRPVVVVLGAILSGAIGVSAADRSAPHALLPVPGAPLAPSAAVVRDHFRFVVGGDNRPAGHGDPMPPVFTEICREIGLLSPDLVLWTGDTIHGYGDTVPEAEQEYTAFLKVAADCRVPFFNIPGNHEKGLDGEALDRLYRTRMGPPYGSFDIGNSHFIGLDTTRVLPDGSHKAELDPEQLAWLQADLQAHAATAENVFVFMHHYVFGPPDPDVPDSKDTGFADVAARDRLHSLFVRYGVRAVFCGHSHLYSHAAHDGVDYFIAGNAGAPLEAAPEQGGFFGYVLVEVDGKKIRTRTLQPWTLLTNPVRGGDGRSLHAEVDVSNYNRADVTVANLRVRMPAAGEYRVTASVTYKGMTKPVETQRLATARRPDGTCDLTLSLTLPHARTTRVTVEALDH